MTASSPVTDGEVSSPVKKPSSSACNGNAREDNSYVKDHALIDAQAHSSVDLPNLPRPLAQNGSLDSASLHQVLPSDVTAFSAPQSHALKPHHEAQAKSHQVSTDSPEPDASHCKATNPSNHQVPSVTHPPLRQLDHHQSRSDLPPSPQKDDQDSEALHSIPDGQQSLDSDSAVPLGVRESSDACREPQEVDSVSVGSESSQVDVGQSSSNQDVDDTNGLPAATESIHQNGTVEDSALHQLVDPEIESKLSPQAVHVYEESEVTAPVLKTEVDLVDSAEPETAVASDVTKSSDVCHEPQEGTLVSITSAPSEADVSQSTSVDQQDPRISDESLGPKESENSHSDDTQSELQQAEVQTHPLPLPEGEPTNLEELESSQFDESEQRIEEEANAEPLPKADENQETVDVIAESCMSNLDQESEAEQSVGGVDIISPTESAADTVLSLEEGHSPLPASGDHVEDMKELGEDPDDGDKPSELDESLAQGDTLSVAPNCLEKESDTVAKPIEIDQAFQVSGEEDKHQHENSSLTNDTVDEASHSETEDAAGVSVQDVEKLPEIPRETETTAQDETVVVNEDENPSITNDIVDGVSHSETEYAGFSIQDVEKLPQIPREIETEIEATTQDETTVVNENEAVEPKTGHVGAVSEDPEVADSSPVNHESGEVNVSEDVVSVNDLGNSISTRPADTATIEFGSLTYQVPCGHDTSKADIPDVESSNAQFAPSHAERKPEVEAAISSGKDCEDMTSNTARASKLEVSDSSIVAEEIVPNSIPEINGVEEEGDQLTVLNIQGDDKPVGKENEMVETPHSEESSASVVESSTSGSLAGQDLAAGPLISPFQYLIRVPRFDDSKVREQMKQAQLQIDEKTRIRDAFRHEIQKHQANCRGHTAECKAAVSDARFAKMSVRSKRAEIDSLQVVINQVKNAMSIDDIDTRVCRMEYMMQHETLPLKEEKQFIREIKQLKQLRQQLSSSIGNKDEVQKAVNEREEIEGRLKGLKKELDQLKDGVIKSEAVVQAAQKKYDDENRKLREVGSKFQEANDARQSAFFYLQSLKKELYEKNKLFRMYKDTANAAIDIAASRDREALQHLCNSQVETIMEAWKDDEFRKEYVSSNMRSTVRRLGTLDGRSLGPDEEPPVLPSFVVERPARLIANQSSASSVVHTPSPKLVEETKTVVSIDDSKTVQAGEAKKQTTKNRDVANHNLGDGPVTCSVEETKDEISEAEYRPTEEELELERKRKEEVAAKLREERRVEEKSKALEALERKKRNAEKAQQRAELRAQKEAEQREKEREKRIRKKEKKKAEVAESDEASNPGCEVGTEAVKEAEVKEWKRPQKASVMSKGSKSKSSIPPPLRNRSKRKMQQWMWVTMTCMLVIFLFVLGNVGFFSNLSNLRPRKNGPF